MVVRTIGPKITVASGDWFAVARDQDNQRAIRLPSFVVPGPGWATKIGFWARRTGGDPKFYAVIREVLPDGSPGALWARSDPAPVPTATAGGAVEAAIRWTGPALDSAATAARLAAGTGFMLEVGARGGSVEVALPTGEPATTHWYRSVASGYPTDPFLADGSEAGPALALWLVFQDDAPPAATTAPSPAAGATTNDSAPVFAASFADPDTGTPTFDKLREYRIEVRDAATLATLWSGEAATFAATASERAASRYARAYGGAAALAGRTVEWRDQAADDHLAYGPWSGWRALTVNAAGQVGTADGTPAGKVETDPAAIAWTARWFQPQGYATDRVKVRVLADGLLWRLGKEVVKTVASSAAPGTAFTVTAAQAGIGALAPGAYEWQAQGRDAVTGQWSPWSAGRAFSVNARPTTPTNLQPPAGAAATSLPLFEANVVDPDPDDVEGVDVVFDWEITRPDGSVVVREATGYDAARGVALYQATALDAPSRGAIGFRVRGRDTSAGALGIGEWSARRTVTYATGPGVTATNPTEGGIVDTATPTVAWTVTGGAQAAYRVYLYRADAADAAKASGRIASTVGLFAVPPGWLKNGEWDIAVQVWDGSNLSGTSLRRRFSVAFVPPAAPLGLEVTADAEAAAVLVTWPPSQYPPGEIRGWRVSRRPAGAAPEDAVVVAVLDSPVASRWRDEHAPTAEEMTYGLTQLRDLGGGDVLESDPVEATVRLDPEGTVLVLVADPSRRAVLRLQKAGGGVSGSVRPAEEETVVPWGTGGKPVPLAGTGGNVQERQWSGVVFHDPDGGGGALRQLAAAEALVGAGLVSVRDGQGRLWGTVGEVSWTDNTSHIEVELSVAEAYFVESVRS